MEFSVNYLGVIVAAIVSMAVGMAWYSQALFGKSWMAGMGMSEVPSKEGMGKTMAMAFIAEVVTVVVFSYVASVTGASSLGSYISLAFWLWLGFMAPIMLGSVLWEKKSSTVFFINIFHRLAGLLAIAIVLNLL